MYKQLQQREMDSQPVNISTLRKMKNNSKPIACLTAYDASFAQLVDIAGTDLVLVGDSLGMVIQGHDTTVPVTVDDGIYHTRTVARGLRNAFLVADLPFMSDATSDQALENGVRLMQEGGAKMVKLEGGRDQVSVVECLSKHDIPVCAHVGLRPQAVHKIGGFRVQGRDSGAAKKMADDFFSAFVEQVSSRSVTEPEVPEKNETIQPINKEIGASFPAWAWVIGLFAIVGIGLFVFS